MRDDKNKALVLRKQGESYSQINKTLGVPKSTLSLWLKDVELTDEARQKIIKRGSRISTKILIQRNKYQTVLAEERATRIRNTAKQEASSRMQEPLFISGVSLYWAEGYKRGASGSKWKCVDFTNTDPEMVRVMMDFFRKICFVDESQFKAQLIAHPNIDLQGAVEYWSLITGIPQVQFIKTCTSISVRSGQKKINNLTYGTVHIRVYDVKLFFKIIGWIDGLKREFLRNNQACSGL